MYSLYRITAIRPKTFGMYTALAGAVFGLIELVFNVLYILLLGGFFFTDQDFSPDVLFLLIPAVGITLLITGFGFVFGWLAAVAYNHLHPLMGTLSLRLSKPYVRN